VDALASAVVAGIGEGGLVELGRRVVQRAERSGGTGAGQIVAMAGQDAGDPDRQPVRANDGLHVAAGGAVFSGIPGVDRLAFGGRRGLGAAVGAKDLAVEDDVRPTLGGDLRERVVQVGACSASTVTTSSR
jgi:hypothetical protein